MEIAALALLSAADRLKHIHEVVSPARQAGQIVICTRYYLSAYAYFPERGLDDAKWLRSINRYAPPPDITFLLDIPAHVAQERIRDRDHSLQLEEEQLARMEAIRQRFLTFDEPFYYILDGTEPPELIHERVLQLLEPLLLKNRGAENV
jgi:dTMP kinase